MTGQRVARLTKNTQGQKGISVPARTASRRWSTILAGVISGAVLVVTVIGAGVTSVMGQLEGNITALDVSDQTGVFRPSSDSIVVDSETGNLAPFTMVVIGSDSRVGKRNRGYGSVAKFGDVARNDTTMIFHVNADRSQAIGVSIPRDTMMMLPECTKDGKTVGGKRGRFNEAMFLGGPGCVLKAVEELTGLKIDNFMVVDFGGFKSITDAVGGVEICLDEDVNDRLSGLKLPKGLHTVDGEQALAFVRARKTLGDGSDTSRLRRQQAFVSSLARRVMSSDILLNPVTLLNVLNAGTKSLTANPQLANIENLRDLALSLRGLDARNITLTTMPWRPSGDGATVQVAPKRANPIWEAMANDTPWPPKADKDQPVLKKAPEEIRVEIINVTGMNGTGKQAKRALTEQGFEVVNVRKVRDSRLSEFPTEDTILFDPRWNVSAETLIYSTGIENTEEVERQGSTMRIIMREPITSARAVKISEVLNDRTANVNTGDEKYCAS